MVIDTSMRELNVCTQLYINLSASIVYYKIDNGHDITPARIPTEGLFRAETTLLLTVVIALEEYLNSLQGF